MELIVPREWFDDPDDLVVGRYMRIISGLFLWTRGHYRYVPGALPTEEVITLRLSAGELILFFRIHRSSPSLRESHFSGQQACEFADFA